MPVCGKLYEWGALIGTVYVNPSHKDLIDGSNTTVEFRCNDNDKGGEWRVLRDDLNVVTYRDEPVYIPENDEVYRVYAEMGTLNFRQACMIEGAHISGEMEK